MRHSIVLLLALTALSACDETASNVDFCPDPLVRDGDRCVPDNSVTGDAVPGCLDSDATNFAVEVTEDDGSCVYGVRFEVDASDAGLVAGDVIYVRGTFNDFGPTTNPLADDDGDDVWTLTLPLPPGTYEYKYSINDVTAGGVDETVPAACDFLPGDEFDNRGFVIDRSPVSLKRHKLSECPSPWDTITFDDPNLTYTLTGFAGAEDSTVVTDPTGGSNQVVRVVRSASAEVFAGTTVSTGPNDSVPPIPFDAANTRMTVRVFSPAAGVQVRVKVEDSTDPTISVETEATTTTSGAFELMTFDFADEVAGTSPLNPGNTYDKLTIFFNFGVDGATAGEQTYYFDDIAFLGGSGNGVGQFETITFDDSALTYTLTGFGGAEDSTVVADPTGGTNQVARVIRSAAAQTFAGTTVSTGPMDSVPTLPFDAANTRMAVRVLSPGAGIVVRLKVEDASDPTVSVETEATTTVGGAFETLIFDFANEVGGTSPLNVANTYNKVTIFFNFGVDGATAGEQTYHFDDIEFIGGTGTGGAFETITFDDAALTYTLTGFGGAEDSTVVADPTGGANQVVRVVKSAAAATFAGTTVSTLPNDAIPVLPFDADNTRMTVRVLSPDAGIQVRLKVESSTDPTITVETEATTTMTGAFETLTFDFANEAAGTAALNVVNTYDKITIFFNFGVDGATAGEKTYHFDDMEFIGGTGTGATFEPITFDDAALTYTLTGFGGAEDSTVVDDPTGGTNQVVRVIRSDTAAVFAGTTVSTLPNSAIPVLPFDADNTRMAVRVLSPAAGIQVRLKVEDANNGAISVETEATTTTAGAFEVLTFDFANEVAGPALDFASTYNKVTIFFNFGVDGMTAGEQTYYFDDIEFIGGTGSGGAFETITFDDAALTYTLTGFGGAEDSTVVDDPIGGTNQVVRVIRSNMAAVFAGTTVSILPNDAIPALPFDVDNTRMAVNVLSPVAGVQVRLKVEDSTNGAISVETEATTTMTGAYETLTFDFANEVVGAPINFANTYDKITIFFNFGVDGMTAGEQTYYFDDIEFIGGTGGGGGAFDTISFDDGAVTYTLTGFGGAEDSTVVIDPTDAGNMIARVLKSNTAATFAGTTVSTGPNFSIPPIPFAAGSTQMTVRVLSPDAGIQVRLKVEDSGDPTISVETEATTTISGAFETLTFDFSNEAMGTAAINLANTYDKVTIFFNFGVDGATAGEKIYLFDDIAFTP